MRIVTWNLRGVGYDNKNRMIKNLLKEEDIELVGLVDTKHSEFSPYDIHSCWAQESVDFIHKPAHDRSGGLIISWKKESFKCSKCTKT